MAGSAQSDADILRWRERALDQVLWAALGIGTVPLVVVFLVAPDSLDAGLRLVGLALYLVMAALTVARRVAHDVRGWIFVLAGFALAAVMFAANGLEGAGRLMIVVLPLFATIVLGPRSGYVTAAMSLALYAVAAILNAAGFLTLASLARDDSLDPRFWFLQGVMLVFAVGPLMILVNRFVGRLRGALAAEREAASTIVEGDLDRRRLEQVLLETAERERRAVGHQLHDGPCQQITAALLRCKVVQNTLTTRGSREEVAHVQAIAQLLDASVAEIHDLARGLSPAQLSPGALAAALNDLAQRARASGAIDCEFLHDGLAQPDGPGATGQLFRIAQEAVSNAVRHARAKRIQIAFTGSEGLLRLVVRDDGIGVAPGSDGEGMGVRIMRHRAELIGGSFSIGPAAGGGTLVTCTLPLTSPRATREGSG